MRRVVLIGLLCCAFISLAVWLSLSEPEPNAPGLPQAAQVATLPNADTSPDLETVASSARRGSATSTPVASTATGAASPEDVKSRHSTIRQNRLTGTVVVLDEFHVEHPTESGKLSLDLWTGHVGHHAQVKGETGRWQIDV